MKIIKAVKSRMVDKDSKYSVRLPKTIEEALALDKMNEITLWVDAITKEMKCIRRVAFDFLDPGSNIPVGYTYMP